MTRTPEQLAADEALTAAIQSVLTAYHGDDTALLTEYVVVGTMRDWDDDGDPVTKNYTVPRDGNVPLHQLLGLSEYASTRFRKLIVED